MPKPTQRSTGKPATKSAAKPSTKSARKPAAKPAAASAKRAARGAARDVIEADPRLFDPLSEGERADALRTLLEDERLREMAKVGRYRVIAVESLATKPPDALAGRRLARAVIFDYARDRSVDVCVDLDRGAVCHVAFSTAQPMLSRDEEEAAVECASGDARVQQALRPGDVALGVHHYWSRRPGDLAFRRRSAAVVFGQGGAPSHVAIVDVLDRSVTDVVAAEQW